MPAAGAVVLAEAQRLERLLRDLLDLARLGAHDFHIDAAPVDLAELSSRLRSPTGTEVPGGSGPASGSRRWAGLHPGWAAPRKPAGRPRVTSRSRSGCLRLPR